MDKYEEIENDLNAHRAEERTAVAAETTDRLRARGIALTGAEGAEDLVDLLSAVERFEAAVEAHGGDLMVDDLKSAQPDDPHFVMPGRTSGETIRVYIGRMEEARLQLRQHPPQPD